MAWFALQLLFAVSFGQVDAPASNNKNTERQERLKFMHASAEKLQAFAQLDDKRVSLELRDKPLLRFDDPAREFHDGTLWVWGTKGRPTALVTMEKYNEDKWWFELHSLTTQGTVEVVVPDGSKWKPGQPGLHFREWPDAAVPNDSDVVRLRQAKELARKLTAYEIGRTGSRYELRLMPQPLAQYSEIETGLLDGVMFAFAYGTNPEFLVLLEARKPAIGTPRWEAAFARIGAAELHVSLDDREFWTVEYAYHPEWSDPYMYFDYQP